MYIHSDTFSLSSSIGYIEHQHVPHLIPRTVLRLPLPSRPRPSVSKELISLFLSAQFPWEVKIQRLYLCVPIKPPLWILKDAKAIRAGARGESTVYHSAPFMFQTTNGWSVTLFRPLIVELFYGVVVHIQNYLRCLLVAACFVLGWCRSHIMDIGTGSRETWKRATTLFWRESFVLLQAHMVILIYEEVQCFGELLWPRSSWLLLGWLRYLNRVDGIKDDLSVGPC